jgi:acyl dehydratase
VAINVDLVGKAYPPQRYEVGREKSREFATAIGDTNKAYHSPDAARELGHPDVVAPPTFGVVVTRGPQIAVIDDPQLGLDFSRVVHGDQKFKYDRPLFAGDQLTVTEHIETARTMAGNDIVTIRSEAVDAGGGPVFTAWSTLVARAVEGAQ